MSYKIGITGVGGGVGQGIMKSLYNTGYEIVAMDGENLGTGLYAAPCSYVIPYASSPNYISSLLEICEKEKISLLFPGMDAELSLLSQSINAFKAVGTTIIVSSIDVIELSDDKQKMYDRLRQIGISVPFTTPLKHLKIESVQFPLIIKQMVGGARSKNVFLVKTIDEFDNLYTRIKDELDNFIAQEYIDGDEYTCGTVNLNNTCKGIIIMRRILRDGDTYKCFTEVNPVIEDEIKKVVAAINPFGACNIQLRVKNGVPYIFEINARCSGTTASRTLCGFNEPKMIADYVLKGIEPEFEIKEQTILRYWNEIEVENITVNELKANHTINQKNIKHL